MALSEHEQRTLDEIESALYADDPNFGSSVRKNFGSTGEPGSFALNARGIAILLIGILLLLGGMMASQISVWFVALSVLGFVAIVAAGVMMFSSEKKKTNVVSITDVPRRGSASPGKQSGNNGFGDRMEDSFRRRFEDPGSM